MKFLLHTSHWCVLLLWVVKICLKSCSVLSNVSLHTSHLNIYSDVVYVIMKKKYTKDRFQCFVNHSLHLELINVILFSIIIHIQVILQVILHDG